MKTKKHDTVSMLLYIAMALATKEIKWIIPLMKDLGVKVKLRLHFIVIVKLPYT